MRLTFPVSLTFFVIILCCPGCGKSGVDLPDNSVSVWFSSELLPESRIWFTQPPASSEIRFKCDRQADLHWQQEVTSAELTVNIDADQTYQSVLGIGTSLESTTLYAIRKNRNDAEVGRLLKSLIDPVQGMGFNMFRIAIGTSDFSDGRSVSDHPQGFYSYQDTPEQSFSIQNDIDLGIIRMLQKTMQVAGNLTPPQPLKFFASCWSPPPWMKTSGKLIGGTLKPGYEKNLALYFRQFIEAYTAQGIPIDAITIQNEPNFLPDDYPGMQLSPEQEMQIVIASYNEFHHNTEGKAEIQTKIWINDHNFEDWVNADYILSTLQKSGNEHFVDAVAFHNYTDEPVDNLTRLHEHHPQTDIQLTEHSEWGVAGMFNIQQYFRNWSRSYMYWVTMTTLQPNEYNQGPYNRIGELSPTLLIENPDQPAKWTVTPEYYLISQFSRFVRPGALRIACDPGSTDQVTFVGFKNPDHTIVVVGVNQTEQPQSFSFQFRGQRLPAEIPAKTVGTFVWPDM